MLKAEGKPSTSRTDGDIIACILEKSSESPSKTEIIQRCNLNLSQLDLYKNYLVEAGLLEIPKTEHETERLQTTRRGKKL